MKRVIINSSTFKLSKVGKDASSASGDDLVFDGFAGVPYSGIYLSGFYPSSSLASYSGYYEGVVNFGKTFSSPPACIIRMGDPDHANSRTFNYFAASGDGSGQASIIFLVTTQTLKVQILHSGSWNPKLPFSYIAMQV